MALALASAAHLFSISSWWGCSTWVSFVSGIVMFKAMRRHDFGKLQSKLFPAYFKFSTATLSVSAVCLAFMGETIYSRSLQMVLCALALQSINMLYLEPVTTKIMFKRHVIERDLNTGHEVGTLLPSNEKARNDERLKAISKKFGIYHGLSTSVNLVAMLFGGIHMYQWFVSK
eukprot:g5037.t1